MTVEQIRAALEMLFTLAACGAAAYLAYFFGRRWHQPDFRAFAIFTAATAMLYLGLFLAEQIVRLTSADTDWVRWRSVVFRGVQASTLAYLAWALRPNGRRR